MGERVLQRGAAVGDAHFKRRKAGARAQVPPQLWRLKRENQRWRLYARMLIDENRWRAQRYGLDQGLVDFGKGAIVPYADLLEEIIALVEPDAPHFGCVEEVGHAREILARGSSADRQLAVYDRAVAGGASRPEALTAVVDWLIAETVRGV